MSDIPSSLPDLQSLSWASFLDLPNELILIIDPTLVTIPSPPCELLHLSLFDTPKIPYMTLRFSTDFSSELARVSHFVQSVDYVPMFHIDLRGVSFAPQGHQTNSQLFDAFAKFCSTLATFDCVGIHFGHDLEAFEQILSLSSMEFAPTHLTSLYAATVPRQCTQILDWVLRCLNNSPVHAVVMDGAMESTLSQMNLPHWTALPRFMLQMKWKQLLIWLISWDAIPPLKPSFWELTLFGEVTLNRFGETLGTPGTHLCPQGRRPEAFLIQVKKLVFYGTSIQSRPDALLPFAMNRTISYFLSVEEVVLEDESFDAFTVDEEDEWLKDLRNKTSR
ncbi:hypothetical protein EV421DRAFT_1910791 [Armillaria borealis]|uniref:F-box domain-containing protein n=1 Tax=Armillaria borealis TaxID=47425 RepID=A0AA39IY82_9AGAR|nr:hypothetical protein EV421DRAFT_1910791 [Armillaria borealis]